MNVSTSTLANNRRRTKKQINNNYSNNNGGSLNGSALDGSNNSTNNMEEENTGYLKFGDEFKLIQVNHNMEEEMLTYGVEMEDNEEDIEHLDEADAQFEEIFSNAQSQEQELNNVDKLLEYSTGYTNSINVQAGSASPTQQQQQQQQNGGTSGYENKALRQTLIYLSNFARYRDNETVSAVRELLSNVETQDLDYNAKNIHNIDTNISSNPANKRNSEEEREKELLGNQLHPFEIAQLGSLSCVEADEAKTLIPSLNKKLHDTDLERILSELNELETLY
ncbi:hypothetical protein HANVADRAFT_6820 [Hanseniaspora valbyensis NRRL Y-1626]|uniref:RNA polymerase Rpb4/RPC9 core domain-containing protein n=1 Tax=Hanseniaspora valbyensis NRRL Y-1626 TaxID=766949 RepID=A0A1B7TDE3_9ASCO|nr:hypothetical protein HANVADRAFT_6820 [Hanseniaspora valbyensis NRRL Y-1626]